MSRLTLSYSPRFTPEALEKNQALVDLLKRIADEKNDAAASRITVQGARYPEKLEQMTGR